MIFLIGCIMYLLIFLLIDLSIKYMVICILNLLLSVATLFTLIVGMYKLFM
jgi:hypothetical protein